MRRNCTALLGFLILVSFSALPLAFSQDSPTQVPETRPGTAPRASAAKYRAHKEDGGFSLGAELLSRKGAAKTFAANVNRCCVLVQVALYPKKDEPLYVSFADFTLLEVDEDKPQRPESPSTVAARLEDKKNPSTGVNVDASGGVGYETGTYIDPVTGQAVHVRGVTTSAGVAVSNRTPAPPDLAERDREIIERELSEKGLPEGKTVVPIAGYLYFPISKPAKNAKYQLVYSGRSEPLTLALP